MNRLGRDGFCKDCSYSQRCAENFNSKLKSHWKCINKSSNLFNIRVDKVFWAPCFTKFEREEEEEVNIQKGDKVKVRDNSWCVKLENGEFKAGHPAGRENLIYEVIETNCKLPIYRYIENDPADEGKINDTIIRNINTNAILFTQEEFLEKIDDKVWFSQLKIGQPYKYKFENEFIYYIKTDDKETITMSNNNCNCNFGEIGYDGDVKVTPITMEELKENIIKESI
jgi:hypothetical protein